jgi:hypothetical protein
VRYAITGRPGFANADLVTNDGDTRLLALNNPMPRAWFVPFAITNSNDAQVLDSISSDEFDPSTLAYVAGTLPSIISAPSTQRAGNRLVAGELTRVTPEHARVVINAPAEGLLVLSENYYYPGWGASVNGVPATILRTDVALSAVTVHAGANEVDFVFDPWSVRIGIGVTVLTMVLSACGIIVSEPSLWERIRRVV